VGEHLTSIAFKDLMAPHFVDGEASQAPLLFALSQGFKQDFARSLIGRGDTSRRILMRRERRFNRGRHAEIDDLCLTFPIQAFSMKLFPSCAGSRFDCAEERASGL